MRGYSIVLSPRLHATTRVPSGQFERGGELTILQEQQQLHGCSLRGYSQEARPLNRVARPAHQPLHHPAWSYLTQANRGCAVAGMHARLAPNGHTPASPEVQTLRCA